MTDPKKTQAMILADFPATHDARSNGRVSGSQKTARKTAPGLPFTRGEDPRRGFGRKGRSGRKANEFKALCRWLASRDETIAAVAEILSDGDHPHFMAALKWASEHGYGKPVQPISGEDAGPITIRVVREYQPDLARRAQ